MATVVEIEGSADGNFEEKCFEGSSSTVSSLKHISDPVVYKLVRVEGDGRLVPATDAELKEVEGLLKDEKHENQIVSDSGLNLGCISNEVSSSRMPQLESLEGLLQLEKTEGDTKKLNARMEEPVPSTSQSLNNNLVSQSVSAGERPKPPDELLEGGSSTSAGFINLKPDFSKLTGEICLDNLSIRELHDVFRATFGRITTVKDKQWLKRRIAMGLTNSCDVSTTTFIIKDNKLGKAKEENYSNASSTSVVDPVAGDGNCQGLPDGNNSQVEEHHATSVKRLQESGVGHSLGNEDLSIEQRAAKRVRKPTRRYIEELSETESKEHGGMLSSSSKSSVFRQSALSSNLRHARSITLEGRTVFTRLHSLGGFGIQVPCVYRLRRSRPRQNFMALMKFHSSGMGVAASLKGLEVQNDQLDGDGGEPRSTTESIQRQITSNLSTAEINDEKHSSMTDVMDSGQNLEEEHFDPSADTSDDNVVTVPTAKGGIRRKHHRAWTLSEVMKLLEGVSRYGAGRWSEIKRLAFASYSYRTSVDLKDKWRNLLRASFNQTHADKGVNSRKHPSLPLPAPILLRVRELAEMQAQVPVNPSSSKLAACGGRSVNETRSGYL